MRAKGKAMGYRYDSESPDYSAAIIGAAGIFVVGGMVITAGIFFGLDVREQRTKQAAIELMREAEKSVDRMTRELP